MVEPGAALIEHGCQLTWTRTTVKLDRGRIAGKHLLEMRHFIEVLLPTGGHNFKGERKQGKLMRSETGAFL